MPDVPENDSSAVRDHVIEAELQQPLPRNIRTGRKLAIFRGVVLAAVAATGIVAALGWLKVSHANAPIGILVAGFTACLVLAYAAARAARRQAIRLARYGTATVGVIESRGGLGASDLVDVAVRALTPAKPLANTSRISYRFRLADGTWRTVNARIVGSTEWPAWSRVGAVVTILYDPAKPTLHVIYPDRRRHLGIIPAANPAS